MKTTHVFWDDLDRQQKLAILSSWRIAVAARDNNRCGDPHEGGCIPSHACHYETGRNIASSMETLLASFGMATDRDRQEEYVRLTR